MLYAKNAILGKRVLLMSEFKHRFGEFLPAAVRLGDWS